MTRDNSRSDSAAETARHLRQLLLTRLEYRRLWQEKAERRRTSDISKAGVARVVALHLWGSGERDDAQITLPRNIKDRVRRALDGEAITPQTLRWFIEAFHMDPRDEQTLWATLAVDSRGADGVSYTTMSERRLAIRQRHRTITLFERYTIGADHSFLERNTLQMIMALEDGVDVYPFDHEPMAERVEVRHGGGPGKRYRYSDGLYMDAIILGRPLRQGESASLEYATTYRPGSYRASELRRSARGRSENIDIAVTFQAAAVPSAIYWAVWPEQVTGTPISEEPVTLDGRNSAWRFVPFIEETTVGFRWEW
jgi:hypothetical protein